VSADARRRAAHGAHLVQRDVDADVLGAHLFRGKLFDALDGARRTLLERTVARGARHSSSFRFVMRTQTIRSERGERREREKKKDYFFLMMKKRKKKKSVFASDVALEVAARSEEGRKATRKRQRRKAYEFLHQWATLNVYSLATFSFFLPAVPLTMMTALFLFKNDLPSARQRDTPHNRSSLFKHFF